MFLRDRDSCFGQSSPAPGRAASARAVTRIRIIGSFRKGACTPRPTPSHYNNGRRGGPGTAPAAPGIRTPPPRTLSPKGGSDDTREPEMDDLLKPPEWLINLMPDARGFLEGGGWLAILGVG